MRKYSIFEITITALLVLNAILNLFEIGLGKLTFWYHAIVIVLFYLKYEEEGARSNTILLIASEAVMVFYHLTY